MKYSAKQFFFFTTQEKKKNVFDPFHILYFSIFHIHNNQGKDLNPLLVFMSANHLAVWCNRKLKTYTLSTNLNGIKRDDPSWRKTSTIIIWKQHWKALQHNIKLRDHRSTIWFNHYLRNTRSESVKISLVLLLFCPRNNGGTKDKPYNRQKTFFSWVNWYTYC